MKAVYRGGVGQWSWVLHRVTGVAVLLFLFVHILDTALIMLGPNLYNAVIRFYQLPLFGLMEIGLFACVLYHSLNGVRITIMDFNVEMIASYKLLFHIQTVLFFLIFLPVAYIMVGHILRQIFWPSVLLAYRALENPADGRQRKLTAYSYLRCVPYRFLNEHHHKRVYATVKRLAPPLRQTLELYNLGFFREGAATEAAGITLHAFRRRRAQALREVAASDRLSWALLRQIERY